MKNKVLLISLAVVLALSVGLIGCGGVEYNLTISSTAGGSVTTPGVGNFTYDKGTVVNLVATPSAGYYHFVNWTGDVGTIADVNDATTTITMNGNYSITAEFVKVIRVGLARDLDESLSVFECYGAGPVYRWFADKVNADGGIYLSDYDADVQIELKVRDFDVMTWDLAAVTQTLILTDRCDFIWGGPGTDCIFTQAPVCNAHGVPLITLEGGASSMIWDGDIDSWPYVWVSSSFANWNQIPVLHDMLDAELDHDPVAFITYIGGMGATLGIEYRNEIIAEFGANYTIDAGFHSYDLSSSPGAADAIIAAAKTALGNATDPNYDIFCAFTYPWNVAALTQACIDNEFNPPAILFGLGANFGSFGAPPPDGFGAANVEGIMCFAVANNKTTVNVVNATMSMAEMYDAIANQIEDEWGVVLACASGNLTSGEQALDYWGTPCYVAALEMWKKAVEAAGNLSSLAVRNALAAFSPSNPAQTVFGDTWYTVFGDGYGGGVLAYECHTGEIGQWQSGVIEIVGYDGINATLPNYCVTANFTYPMTDLWGWLSPG